MALPCARDLSIWSFALGYFACYVPYSALTKALSDGLPASLEGARVPGGELLPIAALASLVAMVGFLSAVRWWRYAGRRELLGVSVPWPGRWTALSGLCTALIIPTTTLAYTLEGASIVFMMLLMRGGLLILAPLVDLLSGRRIRGHSIVGLALSLAALLVAFAGRASFGLTLVAAIDVALYLLAYFVRLRFMSRLAKSKGARARRRYFVEEQLVATPALLATLVVLALVDRGAFMHEVRAGFTGFLERPVVLEGLLIGVLSQGTGVFGGLVLLDARENSYSVPVNRAASILAGLVASLVLGRAYVVPPVPGHELAAAGLIVLAIVVLAVPALRRPRRATSSSSREASST